MDAGTAAVLAALIVGGLTAATQIALRLIERRGTTAEKREQALAEVRDAIVGVVDEMGNRLKALTPIEEVNAAAALNTALSRLDFLLPSKDAKISGMASSTATIVLQPPRDDVTAKMLGEFRLQTSLWYRSEQSAEKAHTVFVQNVVRAVKEAGPDSGIAAAILSAVR
jgi:hypothetical protein